MNVQEQEEITLGDAAPREQPYRIGGRRYLLCQVSAGGAAIFNSRRTACLRIKEGAPVELYGVGELEPLLVGLCLRVREADGSRGDRVSEDEIKSWSHPTVKALYQKAREMNPSLDEQQQSPEVIRKTIAELQERLKQMEQPPKGSAPA